MATKKSDILAVVHESAKDLFEIGVIDQVTMREFDVLCLPPVPHLEPSEIQQIREKAKVSQAVFARVLNASLSTVRKWEIGDKRPSGPALKLLHLVKERGIDVLHRVA